MKPRTLFWIGGCLVFLGWLLPLLMVIHVLESTFFLNFFSWGASVTGLFLGLLGSAGFVRDRRRNL
ncbi:MAG: hypothetical protein HY869_19055 [Chloroflexi bacterium]|nr:hypothetical protein [Chloroflexota bacterium]